MAAFNCTEESMNFGPEYPAAVGVSVGWCSPALAVPSYCLASRLRPGDVPGRPLSGP